MMLTTYIFKMAYSLQFNSVSAYLGNPPNQSLKLTEIAVDDSMRAKQPVTYWTGIISRGLAPSLRRFAAAA